MSFLADQLRKLRGNKTLYQVQQETGLPRITISRYERDENTPSIQNLKKLGQYYGINYKELRLLYYDDILTDEEERSIVLSWALKHLLPQTTAIGIQQLQSLTDSERQCLSEALEQLLLAHLTSTSSYALSNNAIHHSDT